MAATRNRRQIVLDNDPIIPIVGHANDAVQLGLFTGIFAALTPAMTGPARFFVLPAALATEMIRAILALVNYFNAVNRNFTKTAKAVLETVKFMVIGAAILGSLLGVVTIAAVAPLLFVAAIGTNTLYHTAKSLFHAYKLFKETGVEGKKYHAKELRHSMIAAFTGVVSALAITFLLIVSPPLSIVTSIAAIGAAAISGVSALWSGYQAKVSYDNRNVNKTLEKVEGLLTEQSKTVSLTIPPAKSTPILVHSAMHVQPKLKAYHDDLIEDILNGPHPEQELKNLLEMKIGVLNEQLKENNFFQQNKRVQKRDFLEKLHTLISGHHVVVTDAAVTKTIKSPAELLNHIKETKQLNNVFNSFCSEVGEVQKLFLVADGYFERFNPLLLDPSISVSAPTKSSMTAAL